MPAPVCLPRCVHKQKEMVCAVVGNTGVWVFLCVCVLKAAIGADSVLKAALVLSSQRWTRERAMTVTVGHMTKFHPTGKAEDALMYCVSRAASLATS